MCVYARRYCHQFTLSMWLLSISTSSAIASTPNADHVETVIICTSRDLDYDVITNYNSNPAGETP